ncbi:S41 family peptidase [Larsenimonas rhizosphaerae]|uniref:S41 family peptidase n=1 Tax=Larsenimonas rhizosphaerae TaxID=2944682 RepID=A0AA41ZG93_9GAMM|nr:S41 family peptidase [Larsenimonas rhizosphaerae]MCX2523990.1 S41 family peptidase [Larsenimonas rhizosphaerae]
MHARPWATLTGLLLLVFQIPLYAEDTAPEDGALPIEDIRTFSRVFEQIRQTYVDPVDDKTLFDNALRGMVSNLDPHSAYLDEDGFRDLQEATQGEFAGVGIQVSEKNGHIVIIAPMDGTPAARAGLQPNDRILSIDGTSTNDMSLSDAVERMRGKEGSTMTLGVLSEASNTPRTVTLERAIIRQDSVTSRILSPGYVYARISQFQARTADDLASALSDLEGRQALKGLVLDLRNNPGGLLESAVETTNLFLDTGLIVYTHGRIENSEVRFNASRDTTRLRKVPVVVLVNAGTASAAEIVAGALKDNHRAIVMGEPTFGKGSVQTVMPLDNGGALKLTTARYFTPSGRSIQAEGIVPDVRLQRGELMLNDAQAPEVRERSLENHLDSTETSAALPAPASALAEQDYPLGEALNLLKGLAAWQQAGTR